MTVLVATTPLEVDTEDNSESVNVADDVMDRRSLVKDGRYVIVVVAVSGLENDNFFEVGSEHVETCVAEDNGTSTAGLSDNVSVIKVETLLSAHVKREPRASFKPHVGVR